MNPSTINHRPSTRRKGAILALLCAAVIAAFVLWPRPALVPYTTPPLDSKGTRIQLLIPRGWQGKAEQIDPMIVGLKLEPCHRSWLPVWAQRFFRNPPEVDCELQVNLNLQPEWMRLSTYLLGGQDGFEMVAEDYGIALRTWPICNGPQLTVGYWRSDKRTFHSTYRAILDSVKVL